MSFAAQLVRDLAWPVTVLVIAVIFRSQFRVMMANLADRVKFLRKIQTPAGSAEFEAQLQEVRRDIAPIAAEVDATPGSTPKNAEVTPANGHGEGTGHPDDKRTNVLRLMEVNQRNRQARRELEALLAVLPQYPGDAKSWLLPTAWDGRPQSIDTLLLAIEGQAKQIVIDAWANLQDLVFELAKAMQVESKPRQTFLALAVSTMFQLQNRGLLTEEQCVSAASALARMQSMYSSVVRGNEKITARQAHEYLRTSNEMGTLLSGALASIETDSAGN